MSRTPDEPVPRYALADAARAARMIRRLRAEAGDPDLDARFPADVVDDADVDAVVEYTHTHRRVSALVRAAELEHRALLVQYQHQRDSAAYERRLFAVLETGYQLGVRPASYGDPMGLHSRQAVYQRRTRLARQRAAAGVSDRELGDEGRAQDWLDEHTAELRALADVLIDHRDALLDLVDGEPARQELARNIDAAGTLMSSRRPSLEFCGAVAYAVHALRPGAARPAPDPAVQEQLAWGLRLLW
ncbi:hypothetical protein [Actinoplanes sp. G11-F43]|uniref:hypothetical protein n=1 Tax=Actinoplanes sp. G11-F43 TaxID=3424130 RepID=UPI003D350554